MTDSLFTTRHLEESNLLFGGEHPAPDPKTGISVHGPYSKQPGKISVGIIGGSKTVDQVRQLLDLCRDVVRGPNDKPLWTPNFPGMNPNTGWRTELLADDQWIETIRSQDIDELEKNPNLDERIGLAVEAFCDKIEKLEEREGSPDLYVCAPPKRMMDLCLPKEGTPWGGRKGKKSRVEKKLKSGFHPSQKKIFEYVPGLETIEQEVKEKTAGDNLHHLLKARAMRLKVPTQFMKPYTLEKFFNPDAGSVQDRATFCWNLCVGLFYKAGGVPWRLASIPSNTCFIGVSFYREKEVVGGNLGTSLAQVFTPHGEGVVLRGERFEWKHRAPHLPREAARRILEKGIEAYENQTGTKPSRVVLHKSSKYNDAERSGFKKALEQAEVEAHDFLAILTKSLRIKFFREGYHPPVRGTMVNIPGDTRLLFTRGYVPLLKVYPGP